MTHAKGVHSASLPFPPSYASSPILSHGVRAAEQVLRLDVAMPVILQKVIQELGNCGLRLPVEVFHALAAEGF